MTLDEAIEYEEEMVEIGETYEINKGMLEEYRQFTEWLKDYKRLLEQQPILDNIRAEIESNMESIIGKYDSNTPARDMPSAKIERNSARMEVLEIIDKYKAESEDKE